VQVCAWGDDWFALGGLTLYDLIWGAAFYDREVNLNVATIYSRLVY
jgi:hypothetical protein